MPAFEEGDNVVVTNRDWQTAEGTVVETMEIALNRFSPTFLDDTESLYTFWEDVEDVEPTDTVVRVRLDSGEYDYPKTKVEHNE